jgi:hypothetical protein
MMQFNTVRTVLRTVLYNFAMQSSSWISGNAMRLATKMIIEERDRLPRLA